MRIHSNFGKNLRIQCQNYSSISAVCSGIGINRQQFNKYLAGKIIPNGSTLARICQFFNIPEEQLFGYDPIQAGSTTATHSSCIDKNRDVTGLLDILNIFTNGAIYASAGVLAPGIYHCYFPLEEATGFLMRSLVVVTRHRAGLIFSRTTVFPSKDRSTRYLAKSRHHGIIFANEREIYMLGANDEHQDQISLLSFERPQGFCPPLLTGLALLRTSHEPIASRICMVGLGESVGIRQAIRSMGPVNSMCDSVDPLIRAALVERDLDSPNRLLCVSFAEAVVRLMNTSSESHRVTTRQTATKSHWAEWISSAGPK